MTLSVHRATFKRLFSKVFLPTFSTEKVGEITKIGTIMLTEINSQNLAYVGDAVIELLIRARLTTEGGKIGELNKKADLLVRAGHQSKVADAILPKLSEEEAAVFRRGKNIHFTSVPKNATQLEYRKATALEALFGYLYLKGESERLSELIEEFWSAV